MSGLEGDSRGVSEQAGVATLVVLTVVVTASVGVGVLFVDTGDDSGVEADFEFQYFESRYALLVTYAGGDALQAGNVVVRGPEAELTWAELSDLNETAELTQGSRVQIHPNNAYGARVRDDDTVSVVQVVDGNETELDRWNGTSG